LQEEVKREQEKIRDDASIYDILKLEHKDVKKLLKEILDKEEFDEQVYSQIKNALSLHMAGEEKLLYPRLENIPDTRSITLESYEEHDLGKKVINDIDNSKDDDVKLANVKVLNEVIDHHVKEEESELFKKAKRVLSEEDGKEIARQFMDEKMQNLPKP
jgi:hemerythrin-like domain-containing protein